MLCLTPFAKLSKNCNNFPRLNKCPLVAQENIEWGWFAKNTTNVKTVLTMKTDNPVTCGIEHTVVNNTSKIGDAQLFLSYLDVYILMRINQNWGLSETRFLPVENCTQNRGLSTWKTVACGNLWRVLRNSTSQWKKRRYSENQDFPTRVPRDARVPFAILLRSTESWYIFQYIIKNSIFNTSSYPKANCSRLGAANYISSL